MRRAAFLLASLSLIAEARAADLQIEAREWEASAGSYRGTGTVRGVLRVTNNGPELVDDAVVTIAADPASTRVTISAPRTSFTNGVCTLPALASGEHSDVTLFIGAPFLNGRVTITAEVTSSAADPAPRNNTVRPAVDFVEHGPELAPTLSVVSPAAVPRPFFPRISIPPDEISFLDVTVWNSGDLPATNVVVRVEFPDGARVAASESEHFECNLARARAVCRAEVVPVRISGQRSPSIRFSFAAPPLYEGGLVDFSATATAAEPDLYSANNDARAEAAINRFFAVTAVDDDGPGSLRQAIRDANANCTRLFIREPGQPTHAQLCTIGFRVPGPLPEEGFVTIRPRSPLPPLNFHGTVQGATQATWLGLDPSRPRVMLDGSLLTGDADGLVLITGIHVLHLAAGNFPGDGVSVEARPESLSAVQPVELERIHLGVDPSGAVAAPNERGVVVVAGRIDIRSSVISANRRSGIVAVDSGVAISSNRIGVAAFTNHPLPNGASGVFLHGTLSATVSDNVIANHPHFGIATDTPTAQRSLRFTRNSIFDNGHAIDYGLHGPTPNVAFDATRFPNHPMVEQARYDAGRGETVITIALTTAARPTLFDGCTKFGAYPCLFTSSEAEVEVYASSGPGAQTERYLGRVEMGRLSEESTSLTGTLTVREDLRGWRISGVTQRERQDCYTDICRSSHESSEASLGVEVR
jgi:hypothetical protein